MELRSGTTEEHLPDFSQDFPHIASRASLDRYTVPWHWHKEFELFYIKSGALVYYTPNGKMLFQSGSGGLINSNILHMTTPQEGTSNIVQLLHIFDSTLIGGSVGSRIEQLYITPLLSSQQLELIPLFPEQPSHMQLLKQIEASFGLTESDYGYELKLRSMLSEIWLQLFGIAQPLLNANKTFDKMTERVKLMMVYIFQHFSEKISVSQLAAASFCSERDCYRAFQQCLHTTPAEYIKSYRLQIACQLLANSNEPITLVGHTCGLGSSSYFGKTFHEAMGCSPTSYRRKWQNSDIKRR